VPHHNLVADTRSQFLNKVKNLRPVTSKIIIIGPDHFSVNQRQISYTDTNWSLLSSTIFFDKNFDTSGFSANNFLLKNDHTIYNLLSDLNKFFPQATIVPVLLGQKLTPSELEIIYQKIKNYCGLDCLLIASVDFSHYLPANLAAVHDEFTASALINRDLNKIIKAEVDSPQSLYLVTNLNYQSLFHTNSGYLLNNLSIETTTHFFSWYRPSKKFFSDNTKIIQELPYPIDRQKNQKSLGDRFFYGVDEVKINPDLKDQTKLSIIKDGQQQDFYFPLKKSGETVSFALK
jgi:hypothetical protein